TRDAAAIGIAHAPRVLAEQAGQAGRAPARAVRDRIHHYLDAARRVAGRDGHEAEPEAATEIAHVASKHRSAAAPTAARSADGQIDAIRQGEPVDTLEHEGEAEAELQLDDHRRLVAPDRDDVAAA